VHLSRRRVHRSQGRVPEHRTLAVRHCLQLMDVNKVPSCHTSNSRSGTYARMRREGRDCVGASCMSTVSIAQKCEDSKQSAVSPGPKDGWLSGNRLEPTAMSCETLLVNQFSFSPRRHPVIGKDSSGSFSHLRGRR
jgi:hypothetical protein